MDKLFGWGLALWLLSYSVLACSCRPFGDLDIKSYNDVDVIFIGKAIDIQINDATYTKTVTFLVEKNLKGNISSNTLQIETPSNGIICGLTIRKGDSWYMWAYQDETGSYQSWLCTRSISNPTYVTYQPILKRYEKEQKFILKMSRKKGVQKIKSKHIIGKGLLENGLAEGIWKYYNRRGRLLFETTYYKGKKIDEKKYRRK